VTAGGKDRLVHLDDFQTHERMDVFYRQSGEASNKSGSASRCDAEPGGIHLSVL
jgi:hypothetical protein